MKSFLPKIKSIIKRIFARFKALTRKKKIVVIVLLFIVLIIAWKTIANATKEPPYKLEKAKISNIEEVVSETGNITTSGRSDIYSPANGIITEVLVKNGNIVKEGDALFKVESSASEQEQKAAQANYLAAVSALNTAKASANLLRSEMLADWQTYKDTATNDIYENSDGTPRNDQRSSSEFNIAKDNWLAAEAKYKNQETAIAAASAEVTSTNILYQATKDAVVKAPISGTVANLSVSVGNGVAIKTATSINPPVLTIASVSLPEAAILLGENDIVKLSEGQSVKLDISAVDDKKYEGSVVRVDSIGTEKSGVMKYAVYIQILDSDERIRPGMSVDADITTKKMENILTVPNSSIKPYEGGRAVRVVDDKTKEVKFIPVKLGIRGQTRTQIISGISEGQEVVVSLSNENVKRPSLF